MFDLHKDDDYVPYHAASANSKPVSTCRNDSKGRQAAAGKMCYVVVYLKTLKNVVCMDEQRNEV